MKRLLLFVACLAVTVSAGAQSISWIKFDPIAVRIDRTAPVTLDLVTTGTVTGVRLDYALGGSITLTSLGAGRWTASIPAATVLGGYAPQFANHNFVGYLRLLGTGGATVATYNSVINVIDSSVQPTPARQLDSGARATARILNLYRPTQGLKDIQSIVKQFYSYYHDDFDFLQVVFSNPSYPSNRYHFAVRNDVQGIGLQPMDNGASYGSASRLKGVSVYPIDTFFDLAESSFSHELGHQWINFLKNPSLASASPHWPPSTMAAGIMGMSIPDSGEGGDFPYLIEMVGPSTAHVKIWGVTQEFSDLDLYLMGLIPPSAVAPGIIIEGTGCADCTVPATQISINDVIAANGPRVPSSENAQRTFRVGTIVVSRDRMLTDDELALLEYFAWRGESREALPYTSGLARGTTKPFYLATRKLGTVDLKLDPPARRRVVAR